jgi:hypothetical protein
MRKLTVFCTLIFTQSAGGPTSMTIASPLPKQNPIHHFKCMGTIIKSNIEAYNVMKEPLILTVILLPSCDQSGQHPQQVIAVYASVNLSQ